MRSLIIGCLAAFTLAHCGCRSVDNRFNANRASVEELQSQSVLVPSEPDVKPSKQNHDDRMSGKYGR